jgi:hypothetical protein
MSRRIPSDLSATHGEPDKRHVAQIQFSQDVVQVVGQGVVVILVARVGLAEPAPIVGNDAEACLLQRRRLL